MIIKDITKSKKKKNPYIVAIDDKIYEFNEEIILEYRLYKGKEIEEDILTKAISSNDIQKYYNMAESYSIKYMKNSKEVYRYLIDKGLDSYKSNEIVDKLIEKRIIDDKKIIEAICYSLVIRSNGKKMINEKLKARFFDYRLIDEALDNIDYDLYFEYLNKLYEKIKSKYDKFDDYQRRMKIKQYLYQRGYDSNDISLLDIK